jgi:O-antigen/teichoic acid export membrane protein
MAGEEPTAETAADDLSALLSSSTLMLFAGSLGSFSKLIEQVIMGRMLSPAAYGVVSVGITLMTLCVTVALVGFGQGIPRFMARFDTLQDERGAWFTGATIAGGCTAVLTFVLFINGELLNALLLGGARPERLLVLFIATVPFAAGLEVAVAGIRGRENTIYRMCARDLVYNGLRIGLLVVLLLTGAGILAAGYAYLLSAIVAAGLAYALFNRLLPIIGPVNLHTREMMYFSMPLMISSMVSALLARTDMLMLSYYLPSTAVGVYNAAYPLSRGLPVIISSFEFLYLPLVSRLDADGHSGEVDRMYKLTAKWVYIVVFPVFLCLVVYPDDLLTIVFGAEYAHGAPALAILSVGLLMSGAYGRCQDTLSAFGFTTYILVVNVAAAAFNIGLNIALIPTYGITGAAVASAISLVSLNGLALAVLWRKSGITPFSSWTIRTFVLLPFVFLPPALLLSRVMSLTLLTLGPFLLTTGVLSVGLLAVTGCLQPADEIPIALIENRLGTRVPLIRRYIPDRPQDEGIK